MALRKRLTQLGTALGVVIVALSLVLQEGSGAVARNADFETGDFGQWEEVQPTWRQGRASIVTKPVRAGRYAGRFEVRQGDGVPSGGELTQAAWSIADTGGTEGEEWYYAWSTYLPAGQRFKDDLDWNVLVEWVSPAGCPPPLQIGVLPGVTPRLYLDATFIRRPNGESCDVEQRSKWLMPLATGRWMDFVLHVRWSSDSDLGFVELWQDGVLRVPRTAFPTLYPHVGVYEKHGFYRSEAAFTNVVFHDEVRRASTLAVLPRSFVPWLASDRPRITRMRRVVERSGRSWERYLAKRPGLARSLGVTGVSWRGTRYYTRTALSDELERAGPEFGDWVARHRNEAAALDWRADDTPYARLIEGPVARGRAVIAAVRSELATSLVATVSSPAGETLGHRSLEMPPSGVAVVDIPLRVSGEQKLVVTFRTVRGTRSSVLRRTLAIPG